MIAHANAASFSPAGRALAATTLVVSLASLVVQYAVMVSALAPEAGIVPATVGFFSYFTILSNIAVVAATGAALRGRAGFWARPAVRGAVALYIGVTGLVYMVALRGLVPADNLPWVWADRGLHYAAPALYLAWWLWAAPHGRLDARAPLWWTLAPLLYLGWTLLRSTWTRTYPYPFLDAVALGWGRAGINIVLVAGAFLLLGALLWWIDRALGRRLR